MWARHEAELAAARARISLLESAAEEAAGSAATDRCLAAAAAASTAQWLAAADSGWARRLDGLTLDYDRLADERDALANELDTLAAERVGLAAKLEPGHDTLTAERDDLAAQLKEVRSFRLVQGAVCAQVRAELAQARAASSLPAALHSS